ncbi:hypothetical protein [Belnapia rosea]|uniref:hypothetical protein n=1 Tax=Belnapia rosea TaxID=938405 RepID=UPI0008909CC5|nr:hypothetical protein [Belnapia rosea]SDB60413.1 hypothetical protein SAMN02927895_02385 [Belnapia rosea]
MASLTPLDGGQIKTSRASLVGGIAVGLGVAALWVALARDLGAGPLGAILPALMAGLLSGLWVWRADL